MLDGQIFPIPLNEKDRLGAGDAEIAIDQIAMPSIFGLRSD